MPQISDRQQRQDALDLSRSFIVQAPAGSGKTELLIQRYLSALASVQYPEQILCMTFTRKAAGEMRERVVLALQSAISDTPPEEAHLTTSWELARRVLEHDRDMGWNLMDYPSRLKIQTIDSLCSWITGHMPLTSRIGSGIRPEEFSGNAYREAARRLLEKVEEPTALGNDLRSILNHLDNNKLRFLEKLQYLMVKRDQWMIPFFSKLDVTPQDRETLEEPFREILTSELEAANSRLPQSLKDRLLPLLAYAAENLNAESPETPHLLTSIQQFPAPHCDQAPLWRAIADVLLTKEGTVRGRITKANGFPSGKGRPAQMKEALTEILKELEATPALARALSEVQRLPDPRFTGEEWEVLEATLNVLLPINDTLRQVFRTQEVTDFTEISLAAIKALGEIDADGNLLPTELMQYLDYRFQHILVDEYQDTSFKQLELLSRLTAGWTPIEGQTLFIVGDPMQSIYRFRDAEVGLFLETRERLSDLRLEPLTLTTNFRSQQGLVDWTNRCFQNLFPRSNNPDLGEIKFTPSVAFKSKLENEPVELHPALANDPGQEARQMTDLIQSIQAEDADASIAILARAKTHLEHIIRELRLRRIPYRGEDIDPLANRWEVLDLLSLLRAFTNPLDRIAWLAVLRAPWLGLPLQDIHALCEGTADRPVPALINDPAILEHLSEDGAARLGRFRANINPALKHATPGNLRDTLEGIWIRLGGPACIAESSRPDIATFFDELETVLDTSGIAGLKFLEERLNNIFTAPVSQEANLHLMTMHKAKGLEFDFVMIPGLGRRPRQDEKRLVFWLPHKQSLLIAPMEAIGDENSGLYGFVRKINRKKETAESLRLLYVSATRARKQLHLFGHAKIKKEETGPEAGSLLELLWPQIQEQWDKLPRPEEEIEETAEIRLYPNIIKRLPAGFEVPAGEAPLPTGKKILSKDQEEPLYEWAGFRARCLGTVLHRCLQSLAEENIHTPAAFKSEDWQVRVSTAFMGLGLAGRDLSWAIEQCLKALGATLNDEKGRWVLSPHEEARNEYALTFETKGSLETRILDRTFVENGVRWIIDYKAGIHEGADLEKFLQEEMERYRPQLERYEQIIRMTGEARPIRRALYHPFYQRLLTL